MQAQGVVVDAVSAWRDCRALAVPPPPQCPGRLGHVHRRPLRITRRWTSVRHQIPVNAGSIDMLGQLGQRSHGHLVWLRINPGFGHGHSNKTNTGGEHINTASGTHRFRRPWPR
ncbi:MAG: hypothetical protein R3E42_12350 [Burkholderiaceae bacterium]